MKLAKTGFDSFHDLQIWIENSSDNITIINIQFIAGSNFNSPQYVCYYHIKD